LFQSTNTISFGDVALQKTEKKEKEVDKDANQAPKKKQEGESNPLSFVIDKKQPDNAKPKE
jgi:hypothetical protein